MLSAMKETREYEYELVNGKEVMLAAANLPHLRIQRNLSRIIDTFLRGKKCEVFTEAKVVFDDKNWFQPDLIVVCDRNKIKDTYIDGAPDFIAEVLSPTTQFRDLGIKKDSYERFGVQEYWIINPADKTVAKYLLRDGKYVLDSTYHKYTEEEWMWMTDAEKAEQRLKLKLSLYDDLEIDVEEVFEE